MTTYHLFSSVSWPITCLVGQKSITKVPNQKVARWPKCFSSFFFFFLFVVFFRWATSKLRDSFMMVFAQNSSILHWPVHQPITFHNFELSWGSSNRSLNNYSFISDAIFKICKHRLSGQFRDLTLTWNGVTVATSKQVMTLLQCMQKGTCNLELV